MSKGLGSGYDSPGGALTKSPSKTPLSQYKPVERMNTNEGSMTPRGNEKVLSFFNPYI